MNTPLGVGCSSSESIGRFRFAAGCGWAGSVASSSLAPAGGGGGVASARAANSASCLAMVRFTLRCMRTV